MKKPKKNADELVNETSSETAQMHFASCSAGTCPTTGTSINFCTGGSFTSAGKDGAFTNPFAVALHPTTKDLAIVDQLCSVQRRAK
jgi:hypothetical protein